MKFLIAYYKLFLCVTNRSRFYRMVLSVVLGAVALTGDFCVSVSHNDFARAACDSVTHGVIGFISWFIVTSGNNVNHRITESLLCAFFASAIDADHFISARSLYLKDAVRISSRPFMHCTTLVIIITLFIQTMITVFQFTYVLPITLERLSWLFFTATISHHIRDGHRRGLWLWPLPFWSSENIYSTPPISKVLYIICTVALPHLLKHIIITDVENPVPKTGNLFIV